MHSVSNTISHTNKVVITLSEAHLPQWQTAVLGYWPFQCNDKLNNLACQGCLFFQLPNRVVLHGIVLAAAYLIEDSFLDRVVVRDKTWCHHYQPENKEQSHKSLLRKTSYMEQNWTKIVLACFC